MTEHQIPPSPPVAVWEGGEAPQGARLRASVRRRARAYYIGAKESITPRWLQDRQLRRWLAEGAIPMTAEHPSWSNPDPNHHKYRPPGMPVRQWIAENRALHNDALNRRDHAIRSPWGLPDGWKLDKYVAYCDELAVLRGQRADYWYGLIFSIDCNRILDWNNGRRRLGLAEIENPEDPDVEREGVIYRFYDPTGDLLYIGQSIRAFDRLQRHAVEKSWFPQVASVTLERVSPPELDLREFQAIRDECPRFNIRHRRSSDEERSR